ncbi:hypothetical protein [Bordetella holmesii]|uniref:Lipoprotein n=3 Tax=Bordetella holmesii TaxID=35814 RepID=A0ABN0RZ61_9BORD|nr:hypothetical protein [Bordetella holmesii]AMD50433.1 hypothetical protein F783_018040 [Bordetella holmesii F627]EXF90233.1 putative lipoprotein [Bordetella holmesii 30539]EXX94596.1 putative lipoprotein [Bordetella holmesii 1058]KAK82582.1 putative lipoprotein [Bordetella holmesii CDC-H572-BH]KAK83222.1 putative lipoprotein [Bordetella holmesii CDC-H809-BH]KAK85374.1 putative lipoprotein [Bordetella holmesii H620]KAK90985.1 putative lipoprotein [Bordetella holmesii CDC-H635-BH]KAK95349.1
MMTRAAAAALLGILGGCIVVPPGHGHGPGPYRYGPPQYYAPAYPAPYYR